MWVNGTSALYKSIMLDYVEKDEETIIRANTFIATSNAISFIVAHLGFIDIEHDTLGISPISMIKWLYNNAEEKIHFCLNRKTGTRIKTCVSFIHAGIWYIRMNCSVIRNISY